MKNFLIVVDMQNDFVDGALGSNEAAGIVENVCEKIKGFDGEIFVTLDTHYDNYLQTSEGRKLPVAHCVKGTKGHELNGRVSESLKGKNYTVVEKNTFGSVDLPGLVEKAANGEEFEVELIGLCTDICVVSNALLIKAFFPESEITVDSACCAGVTPQTHEAALAAMKCCQINII